MAGWLVRWDLLKYVFWLTFLVANQVTLSLHTYNAFLVHRPFFFMLSFDLLLKISGWYAKSRGEVHGFLSDTKAKEEHASPAGERACLLVPLLLLALVGWLAFVLRFVLLPTSKMLLLNIINWTFAVHPSP